MTAPGQLPGGPAGGPAGHPAGRAAGGSVQPLLAGAAVAFALTGLAALGALLHGDARLGWPRLAVTAGVLTVGAWAALAVTEVVRRRAVERNARRRDRAHRVAVARIKTLACLVVVAVIARQLAEAHLRAPTDDLPVQVAAMVGLAAAGCVAVSAAVELVARRRR